MAREEAGISQRELAKLAGVSQRYLSEIETLSKNVSMDMISALARHVMKTELDLLTPKNSDP
jgi:transcriptional regulator with XRE-family HTH domain